MHNNMFMMSILPSIAPLSTSLFSTPVGLPWYHTSMAPLLAIMFSTPVGLLVFIELPLFMILHGMDPLPVGLFSTSVGLPHNYIVI